MQERSHSKYSPSQAERFFECYGSTALIATVPTQPSSKYAVEGTKAHDVIEAGLRVGIAGPERVSAEKAHRDLSVHFAEDLDDGSNSFYWSIDAAMDYVFSIFGAYSDMRVQLEEYVQPDTPAMPGSAGGYSDILAFSASAKTLFVIDYKHGQDVAKDAEGNRQLLQYAAGALYDPDGPFVDPNEVDKVVLCIAQPRAFHKDGPFREHEVTPFEVWDYMQELDSVIAECEKPDAPLNPGVEQCRFCDAKTVCPAREAAALQVASKTFASIKDVKAPAMPDAHLLDLDRLANIRFHAPMLRKFLDDVEARCEALARDGHEIKGAKLVNTRDRRSWYGDEEATGEKLAALIGERDGAEAMHALKSVLAQYPLLSTLYRPKLISITDAEKRVVQAYKARVGRSKRKRAAEDAKQAFAYLTLKQSSGATKLVNLDDPRPAINKTQSTFGGLPVIAPPTTKPIG